MSLIAIMVITTFSLIVFSIRLEECDCLFVLKIVNTYVDMIIGKRLRKSKLVFLMYNIKNYIN